MAFQHSFHGRTSAAVRVTDNPKIIAPVNEGLDVSYLPLNDKAAVEAELKKEMFLLSSSKVSKELEVFRYQLMIFCRNCGHYVQNIRPY